jgi:hypothetical protein
VDSLPGVPAGASFVGTFDREHAVEDETIDFLASGHALVEGLLAQYEDDPRGRIAFVDVRIPGPEGAGVVAIYKDGPACEVLALDAEGRLRPEWAQAFTRGGLDAAPMRRDTWVAHDWPRIVRNAAPRLDPQRRPYAVAAFATTPP